MIQNYCRAAEMTVLNKNGGTIIICGGLTTRVVYSSFESHICTLHLAQPDVNSTQLTNSGSHVHLL